MKVLVGMLAHEANSFASRLGTFDLWAPSGWLEGDEILRSFEETADFAGYIGGMVRAAREVGGVELIPTVSLNNAAPLLSRETVDYTVGVLLSYVEKHKDELDIFNKSYRYLKKQGVDLTVDVDALQAEYNALEKSHAKLSNELAAVKEDLQPMKDIRYWVGKVLATEQTTPRKKPEPKHSVREKMEYLQERKSSQHKKRDMER